MTVRHFSTMRVLLAAALGCTLVLMSACKGAQSERCKQVCQQETDCHAERNVNEEESPWDLDECIAACIALERDNASHKIVDDHIQCAKEAAGDCAKLMLCR